MNTIKTKAGDADIFIQVIDDEPLDTTPNGEGRQTTQTGLKEDVTEAFQKAKEVIFEIAKEFGEEVKKNIPKPDKVEIEFSLALSSKASLWILSCGSDAAIKVKMQWDTHQ